MKKFRTLFLFCICIIIPICVWYVCYNSSESGHAYYDEAVYVTANGECYHTQDCIALTTAKSIEVKGINRARNYYRPCSICHPDESENLETVRFSDPSSARTWAWIYTTGMVVIIIAIYYSEHKEEADKFIGDAIDKLLLIHARRKARKMSSWDKQEKVYETIHDFADKIQATVLKPKQLIKYLDIAALNEMNVFDISMLVLYCYFIYFFEQTPSASEISAQAYDIVNHGLSILDLETHTELLNSMYDHIILENKGSVERAAEIVLAQAYDLDLEERVLSREEINRVRWTVNDVTSLVIQANRELRYLCKVLY